MKDTSKPVDTDASKVQVGEHHKLGCSNPKPEMTEALQDSIVTELPALHCDSDDRYLRRWGMFRHKWQRSCYMLLLNLLGKPVQACV